MPNIEDESQQKSISQATASGVEKKPSTSHIEKEKQTHSKDVKTPVTQKSLDKTTSESYSKLDKLHSKSQKQTNEKLQQTRTPKSTKSKKLDKTTESADQKSKQLSKKGSKVELSVALTEDKDVC